MKLFRLWIIVVVWGGIGVFGFIPVQAQQKADPQASAAAADPLDEQIDRAIEISRRRYLTANVHTPWQIIHAALALRHDLQLKLDDKKVSGIEWISSGPIYRGTHWFQKTQYGGRAQPFTQPYAFEGHPNQFLGYLTMSDLPLDHTLKTGRGDETITVADMVRNAQMEVHGGEEITWTLWALIHYLPPDAVWNNKYGERWSIERMVQMQTHEPVERGACGGTHGLYALSYARNRYLQDGKPLRGVWLEADQKIQRYLAYAKSLQNQDGSFSTNFFQGGGYSNDFTTRLHTSGHTLEWLSMALYDHQLKEQWVRNGVAATAKDLIDNARAPMDCGPLYHALSGLVIYRERTRPEFRQQAPAEPQLVEQETKPAEKEPQPMPAKTEPRPAKPADLPIPAEVAAEPSKPAPVPVPLKVEKLEPLKVDTAKPAETGKADPAKVEKAEKAATPADSAEDAAPKADSEGAATEKPADADGKPAVDDEPTTEKSADADEKSETDDDSAAKDDADAKPEEQDESSADSDEAADTDDR
jgi:hypothetical protein